jgi:hypothetical protein
MRLSLTVDESVAAMLAGWAREHGTTVDNLFERAVMGIVLVREQRALGRPHLGFVSDPANLDAELHGLFPEMPPVRLNQPTT